MKRFRRFLRRIATAVNPVKRVYQVVVRTETQLTELRATVEATSAAQLEAVLGSGVVFEGLVGRSEHGDERDEVEAELNVRLLGAHQVTEMWRIEGAAEDADAH